MAVRDGMANLILRLRSAADAGSADYTVNGVAYWQSEHLQDRLDMYRTDLYGVPLQSIVDVGSGGTAQYFTYRSPYSNLEESTATGGTIIWKVVDGVGSVLGTALYTVEYVPGVIRFTNDTLGTALYLWGRSYNVAAAAAEVWRNKAAHVASAYDWSSDNQSFKRSKLMDHYREMAKFWDAEGGISTGIRSVQMVRTDLLPKGNNWS
jgi:hypothetical protein